MTSPVFSSSASAAVSLGPVGAESLPDTSQKQQGTFASSFFQVMQPKAASAPPTSANSTAETVSGDAEAASASATSSDRSMSGDRLMSDTTATNSGRLTDVAASLRLQALLADGGQVDTANTAEDAITERVSAALSESTIAEPLPLLETAAADISIKADAAPVEASALLAATDLIAGTMAEISEQQESLEAPRFVETASEILLPNATAEDDIAAREMPAVSDGILTELTGLPPSDADAVVNPMLADEEVSSAADIEFVDGYEPFLGATHRSVEPAASDGTSIKDAVGASKRLDLTQWLSRTATTEGDVSVADESPSSWVLKESSGLTGKSPGENTDTLFKSALFARAMPRSDSSFTVDGTTAPSTTSVPAAATNAVSVPGTADISATGRAHIPLTISFGNAQWSEAVAERTAWLASQQIQSADLQLDPPELGPLHVKVTVHNDQAIVSFVSANPQVREALDQTMSRLREMFQEQGLQLVDAGVSDQHRGEGDASGELGAGDGSDRRAGVDENSADDDVTRTAKTSVAWGVDDFV